MNCRPAVLRLDHPPAKIMLGLALDGPGRASAVVVPSVGRGRARARDEAQALIQPEACSIGAAGRRF
jgi:hypothetical protein